MTTPLDNRGALVEFSTRAGCDVRFDIGVDDASGAPLDITGYIVIAALDDGGQVLHSLDASIVPPDTIAIRIPGSLTAGLPAVSRYSVELEDPGTGVRASLVYGAVFTDRNYP